MVSHGGRADVFDLVELPLHCGVEGRSVKGSRPVSHFLLPQVRLKLNFDLSEKATADCSLAIKCNRQPSLFFFSFFFSPKNCPSSIQVHDIVLVNINIRYEIVREKKKVVDKTQAGGNDGDWMLQ